MRLLHSPAKIFAQWLVDQGLATLTQTTAWAVTIDALPAADPANRIAVFNAGGIVGDRLMSGEQIVKPQIQIRTRGATNPVAFDKLNAIQEAFESINPHTRALVNLTSPTYSVYLECAHILMPIMLLPQPVEENDKRFNFIETIRLILSEDE